MADEKATKAKETKEVSLHEVYQGYADQATAKEPKIVSLLDKHDVVFIKDFKGIKEGHKLEGISQVAFDFYMANGAVEEIK